MRRTHVVTLTVLFILSGAFVLAAGEASIPPTSVRAGAAGSGTERPPGAETLAVAAAVEPYEEALERLDRLAAGAKGARLLSLQRERGRLIERREIVEFEARIATARELGRAERVAELEAALAATLAAAEARRNPPRRAPRTAPKTPVEGSRP